MRAAIAVILMALTLGAQAQEIIIDDFDYASSAAAQAVWEESLVSPPVEMGEGDPWGQRVMRLSCPFTEDISRCFWDSDVSLDLSQVDCFEIEVYTDDPVAVSYFTLYFHSVSGWYAESFTIDEPGWNTITIYKPGFEEEGSPAGWDQITGIRLSPWKGVSRDCELAMAQLRAFTPEVLVAEGIYGDTLTEILDDLGIEWGAVTEAEVLAGKLTGKSLLFMGYETDFSSAAMDVVDAWVAAGGRVIAFYEFDARRATLLGIEETGWRRQDMRAMHFDAPDVEGLPDVVRQATWNITEAQPARPDARVIARWEAADGTMLTDPAWILSDTGAWMSHVLLSDDIPAKSQMILALVGHFIPDVWQEAALRALNEMGRVGPHWEFESAVIGIGEDAAGGPLESDVQAWLASAEGLHTDATGAYASGEWAQCFESALAGREALRQAYYRSRDTVCPEMRAAWEHAGTGAYPGDWDRTARVLADNGFNMVIPNMLSAGRAHYDSTLLPHSSTYDTYGDQVAQAIAGCHAHGVQVHVWKVNWNLYASSQSFIDTMRAAGRTQVSVSGEDIDWLCPSDPDNLILERDTMLEVARNYDVDGIHFDYIRYPNDTCCYCDACRTRFEQQTGNTVTNWPTECYSGALHDEYRDWRADNITALVRAVREAVDAEGLDVQISAAVFSEYPGCRTWVGQDWAAWIDEGLLDFICPMDYTDSIYEFEGLVITQSGIVADRIPMLPGIGVTATGLFLPPDQAIRQIELAREEGMPGFVIFNLAEYLAEEHLPVYGLAITAPVGNGLQMH